MKTQLTILKAARQLIAEPTRWTQGEMARNAAGDHVSFSDDDATCFCIDGALTRADAGEESTHYRSAYNLLSSKAMSVHDAPGLISFNDTKGRTHAEVISLFDSVIQEIEPC